MVIANSFLKLHILIILSKIKSNNKFNVNMDFLMSLKNTKGVIGIKEINEKKY